MARRSPTNTRYQKDSGGKTRKSAAAAKPVRDRRTPPTAKTTPGVGGMVLHPPTEEYRRWRRIWWAMLGSSIVLILVYWAVTTWFEDSIPNSGMVSAILMGMAYGVLFGAIFLDFSKLRRLRKEYQESGQAASDAKRSEKEKTQADEAASDDTGGDSSDKS